MLQAANMGDSLLVAYYFPELQVQFAVDTSPSLFWEDWNEADQISLNPSGDCYSGGCASASGDSDAVVKVNAAIGVNGIYIIAEVEDDC